MRNEERVNVRLYPCFARCCALLGRASFDDESTYKNRLSSSFTIINRFIIPSLHSCNMADNEASYIRQSFLEHFRFFGGHSNSGNTDQVITKLPVSHHFSSKSHIITCPHSLLVAANSIFRIFLLQDRHKNHYIIES